MKTMRSMATSAVFLIFTAAAAVILTGCGDAHADRGPTLVSPSSLRLISASPDPVPVQPVTAWLSSSTSVLNRLTADLNGISGDLTAGRTPDAAKLSADATAGLGLAAPAGHPAIDRAWDAVMNDYLLVSGDFAGNDPGQASADLDTATADTKTLRQETAKL